MKKKNLTIKNNPQRCEACGSCSEACRVGVISPNAEAAIRNPPLPSSYHLKLEAW